MCGRSFVFALRCLFSSVSGLCVWVLGCLGVWVRACGVVFVCSVFGCLCVAVLLLCLCVYEFVSLWVCLYFRVRLSVGLWLCVFAFLWICGFVCLLVCLLTRLWVCLLFVFVCVTYLPYLLTILTYIWKSHMYSSKCVSL